MASNVERVEELFTRYNETGEMDFTWADPEIELHDREDIPDSRVWRGIDGVRAWFAKTAESFDPISWEPLELTAAGRHVVARARIVAHGRASGTPIEVDEGQLWTFRDGMLARLQGFATVEGAYAMARILDEADGIEPVTAPVEELS
jgi:ketosteroid isomerase-like protein